MVVELLWSFEKKEGQKRYKSQVLCVVFGFDEKNYRSNEITALKETKNERRDKQYHDANHWIDGNLCCYAVSGHRYSDCRKSNGPVSEKYRLQL